MSLEYQSSSVDYSTISGAIFSVLMVALAVFTYCFAVDKKFRKKILGNAKRSKNKTDKATPMRLLLWRYRKQGAGAASWSLALILWCACKIAEFMGIWYSTVFFLIYCLIMAALGVYAVTKYWKNIHGEIWSGINALAMTLWATTIYAYGMSLSLWGLWFLFTLSLGGTWAWRWRIRRCEIIIPKLLENTSIKTWLKHYFLMRHKGKRIIRNWDSTISKVGSLKDSRPTKVQPEWEGMELYEIALPSGGHSKDVQKDMNKIESAFHARHGGVLITDRKKSVRRVDMQVTKHDPLADPIAWREPVEGTAYDPIYLGRDAKGKDRHIPLFTPDGANRILIFGLSGAGKSNTLNGIIAQISKRHDIAIVAVDLKGGVELEPWKKRFHAVAHDRNNAAKIIQFIRAEIDRRMRVVLKQGRKVWQITPQTPGIVLIIDEGAQINNPRVCRQIEEIAMLCRAPNIAVLWASQSPMMDSIPGGLRKQANCVICHQVNEWDDAWKALGTTDLNPMLLDQKGKSFLRYDGFNPVEMRHQYGKPSDISRSIKGSKAYKPDLDQGGQELLHKTYTAKEYDIWNKITESIDALNDAELESYEQLNDWEDVYHAELGAGKTAEELIKASKQIAAAIGVRGRGVLIVENPHHAGKVDIHITSKDPLAGVVPFRKPTPRKAADPIYLGRDTRGDDVEIEAFTESGGQRITIFGASDSGKSNTVNVIISQLGMCDDVAFIAIDLKRVELMPWAKRFEILATTQQESNKLVKIVREIIDVRMQWCAENGLKKWPRSQEKPAITFVIEEGAQINSNKAFEDLEKIAQLCRAADITVIWVSQRPMHDSIPMGLRSQRSITICHRVDDDNEGRKAIPDEKAKPELLDMSGKCYLKVVTALSLEMKVEYQTQDDLNDLIPLTVKQKPKLDAITSLTINKYRSEKQSQTSQLGVTEIPQQRNKSRDIKMAMQQMLVDAKSDGLTKAEIEETLDIGKTTFYKYINELEDEGFILYTKLTGKYIHQQESNAA